MNTRFLLFTGLVLCSTIAQAQAPDAVRAQAQREKQPLLDTLRDLVAIESGSADIEGIRRIGALIADRLRALGGEVELVPPAANMPRFQTTPPAVGDTVVARFRGRGTKRILLLAHMDTVYQRGMLAQQPFRVDGDRAYGLGVADDKHGVALILHTLAALKALELRSLRPGHRPHQPGRGDRFGGRARSHRRARRRARHRALVRGQPAGRERAAGDVGRADGGAHREGPRLARRQRAGTGPQRRLRAGAPAAADARPVGSGQGGEGELDGGERRQRAQRHPGRGARDRRHARGRRRQLRRGRGRHPPADPQPADSRHHRGGALRAAVSPAAVPRAVAAGGAARPAPVCGSWRHAQGRHGLDRRRHRRGVRGACGPARR